MGASGAGACLDLENFEATLSQVPAALPPTASRAPPIQFETDPPFGAGGSSAAAFLPNVVAGASAAGCFCTAKWPVFANSAHPSPAAAFFREPS